MYVRISTICLQKLNSVEIIYWAGIPISQDYNILLQRPMGWKKLYSLWFMLCRELTLSSNDSMVGWFLEFKVAVS